MQQVQCWVQLKADYIHYIKMTTSKQGLQVKVDERGEPQAILFRTKGGHWVWYGVSSLDEEAQVALIEEKYEIPKNTKTGEL